MENSGRNRSAIVTENAAASTTTTTPALSRPSSSLSRKKGEENKATGNKATAARSKTPEIELDEDDLVNAITQFARAARAEERAEARKMDFTQSDEELYERIRFGDGTEMVASVGETVHEFPDGLMILASCIPPGPSAEMSDADRLKRLQDLVESAGGSAKSIAKWTIGRGKNQNPYYITDSGSKLRTNIEVAQYLDFDDPGAKLAELMDFLEDRHVPFSPRDWKIEERRKVDGKRSGFSFVFRENGRTFYARNKVAEYLELRQIMPSRKIKGLYSRKKKEEKPAFVDDAANKSRSKKKKKMWKAGDAVRLDYEGVIYDAVVVPTPKGMADYDSEEEERMVSVFYLQEECFEHGVLESRIRRERPATDADRNVLEEIENGFLDVDTKSRTSPRKPKAQGKRKSGRDDRKSKARPDKRDRKRIMDQDEEEEDEDDFDDLPIRKKHRASNGRASQPQEPSQEDENDSEDQMSPEERASRYLQHVKERINSTEPKLFYAFITTMAEYNRGQVPIQTLIDFVVDAFGEDDTDLAIKFNIFLPADLKITPSYIRKRLAIVARSPNIPSSARITYDEFIQLVLNRFSADPPGIERFREIMNRYNHDQDVSALTRDSEYLFAGHVDILHALNTFLPESHRIVL